MKDYLPLFNTNAEYEAYKNNPQKLLLPNVSYVQEDNVCYFNRYLHPIIHATYNATTDNMLALYNTKEIKALKVDGNKIDFEPTSFSSVTIDAKKSKIKINNSNKTVTMPKDYQYSGSTPYSWEVKATNHNTDYNAMFFITKNDNSLTWQAFPMEFVLGFEAAYYNPLTESYFLNTTNLETYLQYPCILGKVDDSLNYISIIDTTNIFTSVTGGLDDNYTFDTEGAHSVEIELIDNGVTDYMFMNSCINNVEFVQDVTHVGYNAFYKCNNISTIDIPDDILFINDNAFYNCQNLVSVSIGDGVRVINQQAFYECENLKSVIFGENIEEIRNEVFYHCLKLQNFTLPNKLKIIGDGAFRDCKSLTEITIPDSVTNIDYWAFLNCDNLTSVTLGANVTSIGDSAFEGCDSLTSVTVPTSDNVISVSEQVFCSCPNITDFNGQPVWINNNKLIAFAPASDVTTYVIPDSVTSIHDYAFYDCSKLTSITIPNSVTKIGTYAFLRCDSLTSVYCQRTTPPTAALNMFNGNADGRKIYVPMASVEAYKSAEYWSDYASSIIGFVKNNEIGYTSSDGNVITPYDTSVFGANIVSNTYENGVGIITFNTDITEIGDYAFRGCSKLTSITIPDSVTSIGTYAFGLCTSLTSVDLGNGVTSIGETAFYGCQALTEITIPDSVTEISSSAFNYCKSLTSITIPDSVTTIGRETFRDCYNLTSVTIPEGVTYIGERAFWSCTSLTEITIPDSVTSIGDGIFYNCSKLAKFNGKFATEDKLALIADNRLIAFAPASNVTTYTIPDSVTTIGERAFENCYALTSITIPEGVTSIGGSTFKRCTSLTSVYCKATTPPIGDSGMFDNNASDRKIYVPMNSVDAYKSAEYWSDYADVIEGYNFN